MKVHLATAWQMIVGVSFGRIMNNTVFEYDIREDDIGRSIASRSRTLLGQTTDWTSSQFHTGDWTDVEIERGGEKKNEKHDEDETSGK